ncbi:MAG: hypothetical protein WKG07_12965, partial [Hymenobacter sp.]
MIGASVRDNRRSPAEAKYYQVARGGLAEDVPAYVDRVLPVERGRGGRRPPGAARGGPGHAVQQRQAGPDLGSAGRSFLARPAVLYVFHEPRRGEVPDWRRGDFAGHRDE